MQMSLTIFGYKTNKWIIMEEESNRLNRKQQVEQKAMCKLRNQMVTGF